MAVPWARNGSAFTLLLEQAALALVRGMAACKASTGCSRRARAGAREDRNIATLLPHRCTRFCRSTPCT